MTDRVLLQRFISGQQALLFEIHLEPPPSDGAGTRSVATLAVTEVSDSGLTVKLPSLNNLYGSSVWEGHAG